MSKEEKKGQEGGDGKGQEKQENPLEKFLEDMKGSSERGEVITLLFAVYHGKDGNSRTSLLSSAQINPHTLAGALQDAALTVLKVKK